MYVYILEVSGSSILSYVRFNHDLLLVLYSSNRLLQELHFKEWEFSIYFVGYCAEDDIPSDPKERSRWVFQQVKRPAFWLGLVVSA